ncbi:hypothetical protein VNO78_07889 [Psophocarpus tetragonolobus]|uniref:Uncharacterized protein n=1 Tax=Psophocarpus tetragonolobus TaxID=3891 RepID=A0AAN9XT64_PSOTE
MEDWKIMVQSMFCEGNFCADALAKIGSHSDVSLAGLQQAPQSLSLILQADAVAGVCFVGVQAVFFCFSVVW